MHSYLEYNPDSSCLGVSLLDLLQSKHAQSAYVNHIFLFITLFLFG